MTGTESDWLSARTARAPEKLLGRAREMLAETPADLPITGRLASAGQRALAAATAAGRSRTAALDLLAADALITLALLAVAEGSPESLGVTARALRLGNSYD